MRELIARIEINTAHQAVWDVLADFGNVADWAPYMRGSCLVGERKSGLGTCRTMRHAWGFRFEETVTDWNPGTGLSFDVLRAPFPMKDVRESWRIEQRGGRSTVITRVVYDMRLGWGGALLDLGLYPMSLAIILAGAPSETAASAVLADTGVDTQVVVTGTHPDGVTSASTASFTAATPNEAVVVGTIGYLRIEPPMQQSTAVTLVRGDALVETFDASFERHGLAVEARHVAEMVGSGRTESNLWPLDTSLALVRWMDDVRSQIGVSYPEDEMS